MSCPCCQGQRPHPHAAAPSACSKAQKANCRVSLELHRPTNGSWPDLVCLPGGSSNVPNPRRCVRLDMSLRSAAPVTLLHDARRFPLANRVVHFRRWEDPQKGGRAHAISGALDPAPIGMLLVGRLLALPGDRYPFLATKICPATIRRSGRTCPGRPSLSELPGWAQSACCHQGAGRLRRARWPVRLPPRNLAHSATVFGVADRRFRDDEGHAVSILRISGPHQALSDVGGGAIGLIPQNT